MGERQPLTLERIVEAAVRVADEAGLAGISMRSVGRELGVEAMSLYHHVRNKEALLDAVVDWVYTRIELPGLDDPWRPAMAERAASQRRVLSRHRWAVQLIESRANPGAATMRHHDVILGCLRRNGFSVELATSGFSAIDSYIFGFVITEIQLPFDADVDTGAFAEELALPAVEYPYLAEMVETMVIGHDYDYANEFERGLELILDAIERRSSTLHGERA